MAAGEVQSRHELDDPDVLRSARRWMKVPPTDRIRVFSADGQSVTD